MAGLWKGVVDMEPTPYNAARLAATALSINRGEGGRDVARRSSQIGADL